MAAPRRHADGTPAGSFRSSDSEAGPLPRGDEAGVRRRPRVRGPHLAPRTLGFPLSQRRWKPSPSHVRWKQEKQVLQEASRHSGDQPGLRRRLDDERGRRAPLPEPPAALRARGRGLPANRRPPPFLLNSSFLEWCPHSVWIGLENGVQRFGRASGRPGRGSVTINGRSIANWL